VLKVSTCLPTMQWAGVNFCCSSWEMVNFRTISGLQYWPTLPQVWTSYCL